MDTLFVGRNIIFLPEVESTNSYAISMLKNVNMAEGTLIQTSHQIKGKGQRGNSWYSEKEKDLIVSIILKPGFIDLNKQFVLYEITALAVYDVLAQNLANGQYDIKIKWPNDVLVNEKKIAGTLIENVISGENILYSVIGIGININQKNSSIPQACSLFSLTKMEFDLKKLTEDLCSQLEKYYLMLKTGKLEQIHQLYLNNFFKKGEICEFEIKDTMQKKKVIGTGTKGLLQLEDLNGKLEEFDVKQVKWIY